MGIPNLDNVSTDDFLILPARLTERATVSKAFPILRRGTNYVAARDDMGQVHSLGYDVAIVLKKDGTYLIGESVRPVT